ncbi:MAG: carboxymuconolactone decarboxylase family protein [Acidobacteriota bacterium]
MPRYLPVQLDAASEEMKSVYAEVENEVGLVPNFIKTLAHSPHHLKPVADLYRSMMKPGSLGQKIHQLIILKTCKVDKCKVTAARHTDLAREAGWTDEQLEAMDSYAESDLFNHYEKDAMELVELVLGRPDDISQQQFWTQLDNHFTSDQVVEMITLIGFFNMINRFVLAVEVDPDPVPSTA